MSIFKIITVRQGCFRRFYMTNMQLVETTRDNDTGIDVIFLVNAPANIWSGELCDSLKISLLNAQKNSSKGIILTSSLTNMFSGGGDLKIYYKLNDKIFVDFWNKLQDAWLTLYSIKIPIATAINGACYGTGCLMAISTEYKVLVEGKHKIGLNETRAGFYLPKWFQHPFISLVGYKQAEISLLRGSLFKPEEALKIGLVNELAVDKVDAIEKCKKYILSYDDVSTFSRARTKLELRKDIIQWLEENREVDSEEMLKYVKSPDIRNYIISYIEYLKQKKR